MPRPLRAEQRQDRGDQACTGPLYSIETAYLDDAALSDAERAKHVKLFAATVATGGTAIDASGNIYASDTDALR